jgi:phospholipid/cholesterol/gamma-HCH transport system substrate-binding protein
MESRFSYTVVGVFVLLLGAALIGGIFWLYGGGRYEHDYRTYLAYFEESVAGLNVNAPVRYRGVGVGRVAGVELAPDGSGRVVVRLSVDSTVPVKEDTFAVLRMQGLTGLVQVELSGGSVESRLLQAKPPAKYPVIRSQASLVARLDTALTVALGNFNRVAENVSALTDAEMRASLKRTFANMDAMTHSLAEQMPALQAAMQGAATSSEEVGKLARRLNQTADAVEKMADDVARTSATTRAVMEDARGGLHQVSGQTLPEVNALVAEMRELAASLKQVSGELRQDPSALVFGRQAARPGPGE